jgi:hypothetical protein
MVAETPQSLQRASTRSDSPPRRVIAISGLETGTANDDRTSREELPVFRTRENRANLVAIYDEALWQWSVPSQTFFVTTRYGRCT